MIFLVRQQGKFEIDHFKSSLTRNISLYSIKTLAFHSLLRWNIAVILPILTRSLRYIFPYTVRRMYFLNLGGEVFRSYLLAVGGHTCWVHGLHNPRTQIWTSPLCRTLSAVQKNTNKTSYSKAFIFCIQNALYVSHLWLIMYPQTALSETVSRYILVGAWLRIGKKSNPVNTPHQTLAGQ